MGAGDLAGDPKRLEEAVAAFSSALEVRTREDMPADWAMTQNNKAMTLKIVGELKKDQFMLEEALASIELTLAIEPDGHVSLDTLQQITSAIKELAH